MGLLDKLKGAFGGSEPPPDELIEYLCNDCNSEFSLPEGDPVECAECGSASARASGHQF